MRHELWVSDAGQTFCLAGPAGARHRALLSPNARLVWTVDADNAWDAMTRYHDVKGWKPYTSPCLNFDRTPYAERDDILQDP